MTHTEKPDGGRPIVEDSMCIYKPNKYITDKKTLPALCLQMILVMMVKDSIQSTPSLIFRSDNYNTNLRFMPVHFPPCVVAS